MVDYPSEFSRLRIGDGGTQTMARGEDNVGSRVDEGLSLTSYENLSSHVDTAGVITWFRPVEESKADKIWKKFSFLPNVWVSFSLSGPRFAACTEEKRGE